MQPITTIQVDTVCDWPTKFKSIYILNACVAGKNKSMICRKIISENMGEKKVQIELLHWYQYHFKGTGIVILVHLHLRACLMNSYSYLKQ